MSEYDQRHALIANDGGPAIAFSAFAFAGHSDRYRREAMFGDGATDLLIDSTYHRDSVMEFLCACQGEDFHLTRLNVFAIERLCDEWEVADKGIRGQIAAFVKGERGLEIARLIDHIRRGLPTDDIEADLRDRLVEVLDDELLLEVPAAVVVRLVDFRASGLDPRDHDRLLAFCIDYFQAHASAPSLLFRTIDANRLTGDQIRRLCGLKHLHWNFLDGSVAERLLAYQDEIEQNRQLFRRLIVQPERLMALETINRFFPASKQLPVVIKPLGVPDGIVAHLKGDVEVTSSPPVAADTCFSAWNVIDMATDSRFVSASRRREDEIPDAMNNWICYDFKGRLVLPTDYAVRSTAGASGMAHMKSWAVLTSENGGDWREIDRRKANGQLNGHQITATFAVVGAAACRFVSLVNIGKNHFGTDCLAIEAWEIFGILIE